MFFDVYIYIELATHSLGNSQLTMMYYLIKTLLD